jgi:hypothetical protein
MMLHSAKLGLAFVCLLLGVFPTRRIQAFQPAVLPLPLPMGATTSPSHRLVETSNTNVRISSSSRHHDRRTSSALQMMVLADAAAAVVSSDPAAAAAATTVSSFVKNTDFWVFLAGIFPFAWATVEFWRRIAFGESFGTGSDSVVISNVSIGVDDSPVDSRGRRVLGKDALITAYILFALAFGTIGIVLYSVITSDAPPDVFPSVVVSTSSMQL